MSVLSPPKQKTAGSSSLIGSLPFGSNPFVAPHDVPRRAVGTRLFRGMVFKQLTRLRGVRLSLWDDAGPHEFGTLANAKLHARVQIHDPRFYRQVVLGGSLGGAEAFLRGYWTSDDLVTLFRVFARNAYLLRSIDSGISRFTSTLRRMWHSRNRNTLEGSRRNIAAHYDLSNEFFAQFLDPTMAYSCGVFERPQATLEEASIAKFDAICRKLGLSAHDHLLEIGSGWGGFAIHAARRYGCRVTTTTISDEQFAYARQRIRAEGLEDKITLLQQDYRALTGRYDKLVSIEMVEAVGHRFLPTYFQKCEALLKPGGRFVLQGITMPEQRYERYRKSVDFIQRYMFPGGSLPSLSSIIQATGRSTDLQLVHLEDLAADYARTLALWRARLFNNIEAVRQLGISEQTLRAWDYYLSYSEAGFRERMIGVAQFVFERPRNLSTIGRE